MDGSSNAGVNAAHLHRPSSTNSGFDIDNSFLGGIQNFADTADITSGNDDLASFLHPDLFEQGDSGSSAQAQAQPGFQNAFNHASRESHSPALPQYHPSQQRFPGQPQYSNQSLYDGRNMYQQSFDPRMLQQQRSTQSPAPLDQYTYQHQPFNQNYLHAQAQQRQTPTPMQQYPPTTSQNYAPYSTWDSRTAGGLSQFQGFPEQTSQSSHNFIDPTLFNGSQLQNMSASYASLASRQQYQPSPYFSKPGGGGTLDPRSLQGQSQYLQQQQPTQSQLHQIHPSFQSGMSAFITTIHVLTS
jgi:hypothetical protein